MEGDDEIRGLPYEYVLQIDGKVKSAYRRFVDAKRQAWNSSRLSSK
jgi:hypothetical protein